MTFKYRAVGVVAALSLLAGCSSNLDGAYTVTDFEFIDPATAKVTVEDKSYEVHLSGLEVPSDGECEYDEALRTAEAAIPGYGMEVEAETTESNGVESIAIEASDNVAKDWALDLLREGLAYPAGDQAEWPEEYSDAVDEAIKNESGYFSPTTTCTFTQEAQAATDEAQEAVEALEGAKLDNISVRLSGLAAAVAALAAVDAAGALGETRVAIHRATGWVAVSAYRTTLSSARKALRKGEKRQARLLAAEKRRLVAEKRRVAAEQRRVAELERQRDQPRPSPSSSSSSGSSSNSSGGGYPGYNGPRCYEPGGKVWHPC